MNENEIKQYLGKKCKVYSSNKFSEGQLSKFVMHDVSNSEVKGDYIQLKNENSIVVEFKLSDILKIEII